MKLHEATGPTLAAAALAFALAVPAAATARTYTVGGDDKNTNITFESETEFETILGTANQARGSVVADLAANTGQVDVAVPVEALRTGIDLRDKHLKSADWLDAVLALHAISTLSSYRQYLAPFDEGPNLLFFAAWPMLAACLALFLLRDDDTRWTLGRAANA